LAEQMIWDLVNPEGTTNLKPFVVKAHHQTLENKTVMLHWNGKQNGDLFLSKIGELLVEKEKGVKIIKDWEVLPQLNALSGSQNVSKEKVSKLAVYKPDIVIGSQGD
jgi:hypothetical protein